MNIYDGIDFIIKVKNIDIWETIGGIQKTRLLINNQLTKNNTISDSPWQKIKSVKSSSISIIIDGIYTGSRGEKLLNNLAFIQKSEYYQIISAENVIERELFITKYLRIGECEGEEKYSVELETSN